MNTTTTALLVLVVLLIAIIATQRMRLAAQRRTIHRLRVAESKRAFEAEFAAGIQAYTREVADRIGKPTAFDAKPQSTGASAALSQNSTNGKTRPQPWQGANRSEKP